MRQVSRVTATKIRPEIMPPFFGAREGGKREAHTLAQTRKLVLPVWAMDEAPQFVAARKIGPVFCRRLSRMRALQETAGVVPPDYSDRKREAAIGRCERLPFVFNAPHWLLTCSIRMRFSSAANLPTRSLIATGAARRGALKSLRHRENQVRPEDNGRAAKRNRPPAHGRAPRMTNPSFSKIEVASGPLRKSRNALAPVWRRA